MKSAIRVVKVAAKEYPPISELVTVGARTVLMTGVTNPDASVDRYRVDA